MNTNDLNSLQGASRPGIIGARFALMIMLGLVMGPWAFADDKSKPKGEAGDDLDVTMQIIVDPDAKLPDDVVRRIPLPARKPAASGAPNDKQTPAAADKGQERARDAKELGREMSERAKERAQQSNEERERARRSEDHRANSGQPPDNPDKPDTPDKSGKP
jgi:hypothetical protein